MKKKLALLLAIMLLAAVGCGKNAPTAGGPANSPPTGGQGAQQGGTNPGNTSGNTSGGSSTTPNNPGTGTPATGGGGRNTGPTPFEKVNLGPLKEGELAKVGPIDVTVEKFVVKTKAPGLPPNSSLVYLLVLVKMTNNNTVDQPINLLSHFKFHNSEEKPYSMQTAPTNTETQRLTGTLLPGESKEGYIGFMVKLSPGTGKFVYTHPDFGDATWELQS